MTTRRLNAEDWTPVLPTKLNAQVTRQPSRSSNHSQSALRPKPLNILSRPPQTPPNTKRTPLSPQDGNLPQTTETLCDPHIVDHGLSGPWPQRDSPAMPNRRTGSPNLASQYSERQSEFSFGILDYYTREPTPSLKSPDFPPPPRPKVDPAIDQFDFGLPPTPTSSVATIVPCLIDANAGAEREEHIPSSLSPPSSQIRHNALNGGYSLFPTIKQVTPPPRKPTITLVEPFGRRETTPGSNTSSIASPPDRCHRPRKESISSSVRSRNDSLISGHRDRQGRIPLRILSSDSTSSTCRTRVASSNVCTVPEKQSRWSDDTITSPSMASTPGPRTSFGSLLQRDSAQYPACFFEDDEEAPLRRKFTWTKTSSTSSHEHQRRRYDESPTLGERFVKLMLCGCSGR
ncbi:hypothetical protein DOTSEDRAFT_139901 [Dothistroma septosporum NZE10]|uniref:Uncharacterized protein n=1 Tax=Dothistroma septosporum (strain NZE10 / CBS 128990) TaxID=675120 RepID=M2YJ74_DOTSN|nr:hypothetical protein DOTSEDRAFT_139901 [Dothistroma septosporum NZE10]